MPSLVEIDQIQKLPKPGTAFHLDSRYNDYKNPLHLYMVNGYPQPMGDKTIHLASSGIVFITHELHVCIYHKQGVSILCPWREAHGYSTPQFRSHAVHDWMVTEWQLHACINHYQGYIKGWLNKALKTFLLTLYVTQNCMRHNDGIAQTGPTTNCQKTPYTFPLRGSYIHYG